MQRRWLKAVSLILMIMQVGIVAGAPKPPKPQSPVALGQDGRLVYKFDERGNRVPDFSYCGYKAGENPIPEASIKVVVPVPTGDATNQIQSALDYVSSLPVDANGVRGAVLLQTGVYEVLGALRIKTSGVVLRGSGVGKTILKGIGFDRETLIRIEGVDNTKLGVSQDVIDDYVPVNSTVLRVNDASAFKTGNRVLVYRPSVKEWIDTLKTDHFGGGITALGWKPGTRDIIWNRTVVRISGDSLFLDAPLTTALDKSMGGGKVQIVTPNGEINQCGVENISLQSSYDTANLKDEDHRWMAVTVAHARDCWVRQVVFRHFAGSAVFVLESAARVTVEDCRSFEPVSEIGGQRRYTYFTTGQQVLFQRCTAEYGYHDFAVGFCAPGPNAFVQCESYLPYNFSGAIDSWASGVLFDIVNIDGNALSLMNRGQDGNGAGWAAANSMVWQCSAARVDCYAPPTAMNWAYGVWAQFSGDGYWEESNNHIKPRSFYYAQLSDRLGEMVMDRAFVMPKETEATSSPTVEMAMELTAKAVTSPMQLPQWVDLASQRHPISITADKVKTIDQIGVKPHVEPSLSPALTIDNGWIVRGSEILSGSRYSSPWWSGSVRPYALSKSKPAITRYVPGRVGFGLTDDLDQLTDSMVINNVLAVEQNYALWYDRRRDDHERIRRMNGEVWPPFYEVPFARCGEGIAWDGLSKYDLTKYNKFYWGRLKQFADLADQKGLLLVHQNYFQHNILEAGAHYADFPWRTANNINNVGFPELPPYAGDKRIFIADQFYDINHPVRRELHRKYIRQCLDNFKGNSGVIQFIGEEFTGPLHFVQFWIDVVMEWEKENNINVLTGLSVTKDVQDSILADPARSKGVDIIDIRYWSYRPDGSIFAPKGGQNLAPRQHMRLEKTGKRSFEQVYSQVLDYRLRFPQKAVIYSEGQYTQFGWAAFMAGGSMPVLPLLEDAKLLTAASTMLPSELLKTENQYLLANPGSGYIIYNASSQSVKLDLSQYKGAYACKFIDPNSGKLIGKTIKVAGGKIHDLAKQTKGDELIWVDKLK